MRSKYTFFVLSLMTAWTLCASPTRAGVYTYGAVQRTVNAGVFINGGASGTAPDKDPYVFYILSQRPDVRPFGWNLVNPLAPKSVTGEVKARWDVLDSANPYVAGQPVQPNMAAYWEVSLPDASPADLAQFDVLLLNLSRTEKLTAASAEKLRRFVDAGGVLWIEDSGGGSIDNSTTTGGPLFSPLGGSATAANNLTFGGGGGNLSLPNAPYREPLLSTPYLLSEQEILNLGVGQAKSNSHTGGGGLLQSVLVSGSGAALSAGQLGAGFVVSSSTQVANAVNEYVGGVNIIGGNSGAFSGINYAAAPSGDLKLVCNIIASAGEAPHERQNAHQQGGAANALSAAALSWTFPIADDPNPKTAVPVSGVTGSAINGQIVFVTDAAGHLHAFDTNPAEDLNGDGNPDDGALVDFSAGKPYDELWNENVGQYASAPTVAYDPGATGLTGGKMAVFVEKVDGSVVEYDASAGATGGTVLNTFTPPALNAGITLPNAVSPYGTATGSAAPAPTVYEGRIYAGQAKGTLFVQDLVTATNKANLVVNIDAGSNSGAEYVCASPSVGLQTETQRGADTNDIIAYVTTNHGVYTVFCGARGEQLLPVSGGLNTKLQALKPTGMAYGRVLGTPASPALRLYNLSGGYPVAIPSPPLGSPYPSPDFTGTYPSTTTYFADYDVDFAATVTNANTDTGPLTRTGYSASSPTNTPALNVTATMSAAALDHFGNAFFTDTHVDTTSPIALNSSLFCVHDSYTPTGSSIAWRFRLPTGGDGVVVDADGTNYAALTDFRFVGAPVVDAQGFVYALASDANNNAAVLCLNGQGPVTLDVFDAGTAQPISSATYTQPIPAGDASKPNEFGDTPAPPIGPQQYTDRDTSGHLTLTNFGAISGMNGHELSPTLSEPQPVTVQYTPSSGPTGTAASTLTTTVAKLHTNLLWFTTKSNVPNATGLALVGNRLYFGDSNGNLYRVIADPIAEGVALTNKFAADIATNSDGTKMVSDPVPSGLTAVGGTLTAANGTLVVNGTDGVSCFADRTTLVVDANRVMEVDADGQATWVVDSTTRATTEGGNPQVLNTGSPSATQTGQTVTTDLALSRPSSVTQLTRNDYLVADTGNNRVVRFDRSAHVIWELSKFNGNGLLTAGEADTLNQPTSVQIFREQSGTNTLVHYLVSDSGNYRVVEVTDTFDNKFNLTGDHVLTWISRTGDKQGRQYRYQSASYFYGASGKRFVIALVTNTRLAKLPGGLGVLAPANQDAPGGSVVLLDYVPVDTTVGTQKGGYISSLITKLQAYVKEVTVSTTPLVVTTRFDVASGAAGTAAAGTTLATLQVRNPRYLKPYTKPTAGGGNEQRFLLADDNGVFDLNAGLVASWGFTQDDYRAMQNPLIGVTGSAFRANLPFIPTCVQRLTATDALAGGALVNHYLVTASYSQGESVHDPALAGLGGEAFETSVDTAGTFSTDATTGGGFGGHTLSRPGNTNPLEQPTFTYRLQ